MRPLKLRFVFETAFSPGPMCPPKQAPQIGGETIDPGPRGANSTRRITPPYLAAGSKTPAL